MYQGKDTSWRDLPKRMSFEVIDILSERLIQQSLLQDAGFAIVLHGGEPLLLGYEGLSRLILWLREKLNYDRYPISIQTNGSLLDDAFLDLFSEYKVSVSISIDGAKAANDLGRIDLRGRSTFIRTVSGLDKLRTHPDSQFLFAGTLTVIQPSTSAADTYAFLKNAGSPNMDFLLQDGNYDKLPLGKMDFNSTEYGSWLSELFSCYVADPAPVPIRLFDDIIRIIFGSSSFKEGQGVESFGILIIETNGEIRKNDTLRSSFEGADFFKDRWNIADVEISKVLSSQEFLDYSQMQIPISKKCRDCSYFAVCGGGMPLYRWGEGHNYDAPSVYCADHIVVIDSIKNRLILEGVL